MMTLRQVWDLNGQELPFAARLKFWGKDTYVVIIQFGPYYDGKDDKVLEYLQHPIGIPFTDGYPNNILARFPLFSKYFAIPRYDYPEWEPVEGIDLSRFQKKDILNLKVEKKNKLQ